MRSCDTSTSRGVNERSDGNGLVRGLRSIKLRLRRSGSAGGMMRARSKARAARMADKMNIVKRSVFRLAVILFAGAIVNVAVAWTIAHFDSVPNSSGLLLTSEMKQAFWKAYSDRLSLPSVGDHFAAERYDHFGFTETSAEIVAPDGYWSIIQNQHGLPSRSLEGTDTYRAPSMTSRLYDYIPSPFRRKIPPRAWTGYLPIRPIWPGFAINTVFYAAVLWVLLAAPGAVRRFVRRRRGRCTRC